MIREMQEEKLQITLCGAGSLRNTTLRAMAMFELNRDFPYLKRRFDFSVILYLFIPLI